MRPQTALRAALNFLRQPESITVAIVEKFASYSLASPCDLHFLIFLLSQVFCGTCTSKRCMLPRYGFTKKKVRVCDNCFTNH